MRRVSLSVLTSILILAGFGFSDAFAQGPSENPSEKTLETECAKKENANDFDHFLCLAIFSLQSQIDALVIDITVNWADIVGIPADIADGDDIGITTETDPVFDSSIASTIIQTDVDNWNDDADTQYDGTDFATSGQSCPPNQFVTGVDEFGTLICNSIDSTPTPEPPTDPILELCNAIDDDSNPSTPDGADETWFGQSCDGPDGDFCSEGAFMCTDGGQVCSDTTGTSSEICDGLDNDCDGTVDEEVHASVNTKSTAAYLGSHCTDSSSGFLCPDNSYSRFSSESGNTGKYFRTIAEECSNCPADLEMRFDLTVPSGIDYDLFVYDDSNTLLGSSTSSVFGANESVSVVIDDTTGTSFQNVPLIIEVKYVSGNSCSNWTLDSFKMS